MGDRSEHFIGDAQGRDNVTTAEMAMDGQGPFPGDARRYPRQSRRVSAPVRTLYSVAGRFEWRPVCYHARGALHARVRGIYTALGAGRRLSRSAVVTCSNFVTQRLQARLPYLAGRIHTVGNGADTKYFEASERRVEPGKFRILFVGRVSPEKGVHTLATAFTRLAADDPGVELDVVGPPGLLPYNQIRLLSSDPQVAALATFYGTGFWDRLTSNWCMRAAATGVASRRTFRNRSVTGCTSMGSFLVQH